MKAIVQREYGPADGLHLDEVDQPAIKKREVLVRVVAASVHPGDAMLMQGLPYVMRAATGLRRPRNPIPGLDVAGTVEAVGPEVSRFKPGDEVFGNGRGTLAELAAAKESQLATKPANVSFEEAAALTVSGLAALRAVRDVAAMHEGQSVLVNGAAGGIGVYAVQIAKSLGAHVVGVCGPSKADLVRSLGADEVIDYTVDDFTKGARRYDVILDNVGNTSLSECRQVLAPRGTLIPNSGTTGGRWLGPLPRMVRAAITSLFSAQRIKTYLSIPNQRDLDALVDLVASGAVRPVVGSVHPLGEAAAAMRVVTGGHATGKVVVTVATPG